MDRIRKRTLLPFVLTCIFISTAIFGFLANSVYARSENIPGYATSDRVHAGEGWVEYNFARGNEILIRSNVNVDLSISLSAQLTYRSIALNVSNDEDIAITIHLDEFGNRYQQRQFKRSQNRYRNRWGSYVEISTNSSVERVEILAQISGEQNVDSEDEWAIATGDEEWAPLETEVESDSYISTVLTDTDTSIYLSVFSSSFDWVIIVVISVVAVVIISSIIVFSKSEYREFIRNRVLNRGEIVHRLSIDEVLENENRSKIIDLILDNPGIHFNELLRRTKLSPGNLVWHLDILETYKIIGKKNIGQYLVYFPYYNANPMSKIDIKLAKSKETLQILDMIEKEPGTYGSKIARSLDMDHKTIKYHVDKLLEAELVKTEKKGRRKCLYPVIGNVQKLNIDKENILNGKPEAEN